MGKTLIERIRNKVRGINREKVQAEITALESSMPFAVKSYNPHLVNIGGEAFNAYDAKVINRALNQTGRGDKRYLARDGKIVGLASHRAGSNGYRRII